MADFRSSADSAISPRGEVRTFSSAGSEQSPSPPRLLDVVREAIRARHYSRRTEKAYGAWIQRFILFHRKRDPREMGPTEVIAFVSHLVGARRVSASTQNQALSALLFLYGQVLGCDLGTLEGIVRPHRPVRVPLVLSREEVGAVLRHLHGTPWLMASLLYGCGLRLLECAQLRVKDVDLVKHELVVRDGKGRKDRVTMIPNRLTAPMAAHLERVKRQHQDDLREGAGSVALPDALERKYPRAAWAPSPRISAAASVHRGGTRGGVDETGQPAQPASFIRHPPT